MIDPKTVDTLQMALVELEIVNQFVDEVVKDRKVTLSGIVGTLGNAKISTGLENSFK